VSFIQNRLKINLSRDLILILFDFFRYLLKSTQYYNSSELIKSDSLPLNDSMTSLPKGMAKAHEIYGSPK
jgi:hypothetical protein